MGRRGRGIQGDCPAVGKGRAGCKRDHEQVAILSSISSAAAGFKVIIIGLIFLVATDGQARARIGQLSSSREKTSAKHKSNIYGQVFYHWKSQNFIDIEAPLNNVWIGCDYFETNGVLEDEDDVAFMDFDVIDGDESFHFFYRRPLSIGGCLEEEKEYRKILGSSKTVRLACDHPDLDVSSNEKQVTRVPERFLKVSKRWSCFFGRMQAEGRCKAFFEDDCDIKKNYWLAAPAK